MRLLVIEDEKRIAAAIKSAMELHNFAVDIVLDADSGLSAAIDPDYDLIILDRGLPGSIEGAELCRKVREANVHTPILMLTARGEVDDKVYGLQAGADDYLVKPFSMKELIVRVQVLLRRPRQSLGSIIRLDDLEVNAELFDVKRGGMDVKLSAREFKLLTYLLYNQGQTLPKAKIISHVWDGDTLIMPNTVEVYIGYLRKKIDKAFPERTPLINTVHGFGYRIGKPGNV
jgi:two-component system copper resistance phosphate regulon response regulator CusR